MASSVHPGCFVAFLDRTFFRVLTVVHLWVLQPRSSFNPQVDLTSVWSIALGANPIGTICYGYGTLQTSERYTAYRDQLIMYDEMGLWLVFKWAVDFLGPLEGRNKLSYSKYYNEFITNSRSRQGSLAVLVFLLTRTRIIVYRADLLTVGSGYF